MNRFIERHTRLSRYTPASPKQSGTPSARFHSVRARVLETSAPTQAAPQSEDELNDLDWYLPSDLIPNDQDAPAISHGATRNAGEWADDAQSADYYHLGEPGVSVAFELTGTVLSELARLNRFDVTTGQDEVLFGLRGCRLMSGTSTALVDRIQLSEDVPDHRGLHCVLGVWKRSNNKIAAFQGSTVPNWIHMRAQVRDGGQRSNMLLTGLYDYTVNMHRAVVGAFKQQPHVIVLRSNDDLMYERSDLFERHSPADNIHPAFFPSNADFSSAGCQTVPGHFRDNTHHGNWGRFRAAAGLKDDPRSGWNNKYRYMLLTGREARLTADNEMIELTRLRFGSSGTDVAALQQGLRREGLYNGAIDSKAGSGTCWAFIRWQQNQDSQKADGIVTPSLGLQLGFDMVQQQSVSSASSVVNRWSRGMGSPGDGSPFVDRAVEQVWGLARQHNRDAGNAQSTNRQISTRISGATGIGTDANPYHGLTELTVEAVVRASFTSTQMPSTLLSIWAKEGSNRAVSTWRTVPGATTEANARTMFRNQVYYEDMGADLFMNTTRPGDTGDNQLSNEDSEAVAHEASFRQAISSLVSVGTLGQDLSGQINGELTVRGSARAGFSVRPTVKFYALSLLLVDAEFSHLAMQEFTQLSHSTPPLTYIHWNTGTTSFRTFLESADRHRLEPEFGSPGNHPTVEHWALRTRPKSNEWRLLRINGIRFGFYGECYEPLFRDALRLIKPGIEDLVVPENAG